MLLSFLFFSKVLPESGVDMEDIGGCADLLAQIEDDVIFPLLIQASNITIPSAYYGPPKGFFKFLFFFKF